MNFNYKKFAWAVLSCVVSTGSSAASFLASDLEKTRPSQPPLERWGEDYRFLSDSSKRTDRLDPYRYVEIDDDNWLQFGAEARYSAEAVKNPGYGLRGVDNDSYFLQRLQVHADGHLLNDSLRVFAQLQNTESWGKDLVSVKDQNRTEFQQAFADWNYYTDSGNKFYARYGRQEMEFGRGSLVSFRDSANVRTAFQGTRVGYSQSGFDISLFNVRPIVNDMKSFDDKPNSKVRFSGAYATLKPSQHWGLDLYVMELRTKERLWDAERGDEKRYTVGSRFFGEAGKIDWSYEFTRQTGHIGDADISAWAVGGDIGYRLNTRPYLRLSLRTEVTSGDKQPRDGKAGTFDPMFGLNGYYGGAVVTQLSNIVLVGPELRFSPARNVIVLPGAFMIWKQSDEDGVYVPGMGVLPGSTQMDGRRVGTSYRARTRWLASQNLTFDFDVQYFDVSRAMHDIGADDVSYAALRTTFRF